MKRLILNIVILTITFFTYTASSAQTDAERAEMGKMYLDKMSAKNKQYTTICATFTVTVDNKQLNTNDNYNGKLSVKGDKYILDFMDAITYFDGTTICTWQVKNKEANLTTAEDDSENPISPMRLLGSYENGYKMRYIQDVKIGDTECVEVDLYPTQRKAQFSRVRLTIDKKQYMIKRLMQQGKNGTSYYVTINSFNTNMSIADTEFTFNSKAHPDVEIIDLR